MGAHCAISSRPVAVEPVNESARTVGLAVSTAPIFVPAPVTMFSTPAGTPARSPSFAIASAVKGVSTAGLATIVQPAASAGAIFRAIIAAGKFHGVIAAATPMGSRSTTMRAPALWLGITCPSIRFASSPNHSRNDAA